MPRTVWHPISVRCKYTVDMIAAVQLSVINIFLQHLTVFLGIPNIRNLFRHPFLHDSTITAPTLMTNRQSTYSLKVLVGTNDLTKGGQYYNVTKLTPHENYNNPRFAYDIAVIKLQEKIEFNEKVQPIELSKEEVPDGAQVQLTGWGRLSVRLTRISILQLTLR